MKLLFFFIRILSYFLYTLDRVSNYVKSGYYKLKIQSLGGSVGSHFIVKNGAFIKMGKNTKIRIGSHVIISGQAKIYIGNGADLSIGDHVFVGGETIIVANFKVAIGEGTQIAHHTTIIDTDHVYDDLDTPLRLQGNKREPILIGKEVWIAANAVVLKGKQIGDHCVIGAGTVVTKSIPAGTLYAGELIRPMSSNNTDKGQTKGQTS